MRWRLGIAAVALGVAVVAGSELLSLVRAFDRAGLLAFWGALAVAGVVAARWRGWRASDVFAGAGRELSGSLARVRGEVRESPVLGVALALGALFAGVVAAMALAAAPNTWDVLTYHMGRVAHWVSNQGVGLYPTHSLRQLRYPPGAEMAVAQLQVLWGGDRLANLVQLGAWLGCIAGASELARRLGAALPGQVLAGALVLSLPMAVMQATSVKNDLVVGFWLVCLAGAVLVVARGEGCAAVPEDGEGGGPVRGRGEASGPVRGRGEASGPVRGRGEASGPVRGRGEGGGPVRAGAPSRGLCLFAGASLGLALLTKLTAWLYAPPLLAWGLVVVVRRWGATRAVAGALALAAAVVVALNAGHVARSARLALRAHQEGEGDFAGRYVNDRFWGPRTFVSNASRNLALHAATPVPGLDARVEATVRALHRAVGARLDDPRTTYPPDAFRGVHFTMHEDRAGSPIHLGLACLVPFLLWRDRSPLRRLRAVYAGAVLAGGVLFCAILEWQPWHARLHTPLFVLGAPLLGALLAPRLGRRATAVVAALLVLSAVPWVVWAWPRRAVGPESVFTLPRAQQTFLNRPELEAPYRAAVARVREAGCRRVGLVAGGNDWEYPFWALLGGPRETRIEHVRVENASRAFAAREEAFRPCAVLSTEPRAEGPLEAGGVAFELVSRRDPVSVYLPAATATEAPALAARGGKG